MVISAPASHLPPPPVQALREVRDRQLGFRHYHDLIVTMSRTVLLDNDNGNFNHIFRFNDNDNDNHHNDDHNHDNIEERENIPTRSFHSRGGGLGRSGRVSPPRLAAGGRGGDNVSGTGSEVGKSVGPGVARSGNTDPVLRCSGGSSIRGGRSPEAGVGVRERGGRGLGAVSPGQGRERPADSASGGNHLRFVADSSSSAGASRARDDSSRGGGGRGYREAGYVGENSGQGSPAILTVLREAAAGGGGGGDGGNKRGLDVASGSGSLGLAVRESFLRFSRKSVSRDLFFARKSLGNFS